MFTNEYLYFNWLGFFRSNKDDNSGRLDPRELNVKTIQINTLTIKAPEGDIKLHEMGKEFKGQLNTHLKDSTTNSCSLHWLEIEPGECPSTYRKELLQMGEKMLLIFDWQKFFEILDGSIENLGFRYSRKKIIYYDPSNYNGDLSLHHKDKKFDFQNEYRILITPTDQTPVKIPLPSLKGISTIINTEDYMNLRIEIENLNYD